ncbi:MAG: gliding motility lipoprotein GldH [Chitinophagaceae bacterium]|nr:gliding motility lipoprotein GldH [Chitinophagaceae bacterium]MCW5929339.1 gliding motility lipoprotein GldH [Chitinophagaceae bacterium]
MHYNNLYKLKAILIFFVLVITVLAPGCKTVDVFEKNVSILKSEWQYNFRPDFNFVVTDTVSLYNIYVTLRHTYAYSYNNIWLNLHYTLPGDSARQQKVDILLADNQKGKWLGTGMDDIYEIRHLVSPQPFRFSRSGECNFILEQIMRDNPLKHVINAGVRVEKVTQ